MRIYVAFMLLLGCSCETAAPTPEVAPEVPACEVVFTPEADIAELAETAAFEWSEATGCNVHTGEGGIPVSFVDRVLTPKGEPMCGETHRLRDEAGAIIGVDFIHISTNRADRCHLTARDVLHEMGHGLAPHRGHTPEGLMADHWTAVDYVDAVSAAFVCGELGC